MCAQLIAVMLMACGVCFAAKLYTGKASLCGIRINDTFTSVFQRYGRAYQNTTISEMENTHALIYNDPKIDAQIIITCGAHPFPGIAKAKVDGIFLKRGRYMGKKYLANTSFAKMGTAEGIALGATKREILQKYPDARFFMEGRNERGSTYLGNDKNGYAIDYEFTLRKGILSEVSHASSQ